MQLQSLIRGVPNWPKPGILFYDITTLWKDPTGLHESVKQLAAQCIALKPDIIIGAESRGFIVGAALAYEMGIGFAPVRKPGKLPADTISESYTLEYGKDELHIHTDAIRAGQRVLIADDLAATGGTAQAMSKMIATLGGVLVGYAFIVELDFLSPRSKLTDAPIISLIHYDNENVQE